MSFILPDLVIESIIRDGLANLVKKPKIIDNIFSSLTESYNAKKYGNTELQKIKDMILKTQIKVVHSFGEIGANTPCYSIQLGSDAENPQLARLDDFDEDLQVEFTDPADIADTIVVDNFIVQSYNSKSGQLNVADGVDITQVHPGLRFIDASGNEFIIQKGKSQATGAKFFFLEKNLTIDDSDFVQIMSTITYDQFEINGVTSNVNIMIGVHSKDALTTKYMYILLKYFLVSRKTDLVKRCFINSSFQGSDFTRNMEYLSDMVFNRFMTATGHIEDSWRGDEVEVFEDVSVIVKVPKDEARAKDLDIEDATVQPGDTQQEDDC